MTSDFAEGASEGGSDTSSVQQLVSAIVETLNTASKGKSKGKGKKVSGPPREASGRARSRMWRAIVSCGHSPEETGRAGGKPKGKVKCKGRSGGKAKGKGKCFTCYVCGGLSARLCWQDAPEGEDTNEEGCWTEEDDETLQLGCLGIVSCLMSSPPGLRDAFNEAGWTVVTRKSRESPARLPATRVL